VTGGVEVPRGTTILDKRRDAHDRLDYVRRLLVHEPRGHADMYGGFVVEPEDAEAHLGVVFFHNAGYSTACGHGTIALVTWALDEGIVEKQEGENHVVVDVPSGRLDTWAQVEDGRVRSVRFRNVPSFVWAEGVELSERTVDVAFGGAFYASLEERVETAELPRLIELGRELKRELEAWQDVVHPLEPELRDIYGVIFWQEEGDSPLIQRNVTVFADGEVDRSPCGSGTSARLALLDRAGRLPRGEELCHRSIVDTEFTGRVVRDTEVAGLPAVVTEVEGSAYRTGEHVFVLDPSDHWRTASCSAERVSDFGGMGTLLESPATCFRGDTPRPHSSRVAAWARSTARPTRCWSGRSRSSCSPTTTRARTMPGRAFDERRSPPLGSRLHRML
jgi:proline racemase